MRVALCQLDLAWEDVTENHRRAERRVQEAAALGAELVVLPEMFSCGFSMDAARFAEGPDGPTARFLQDVAAGLEIHLIAGVPGIGGPEDTGPGGARLAANLALWVAPDGRICRYQKLHPFSFAGEHRHYAPGREICTWEIRAPRGAEVLRVTPFICYDLRFPEVFRAAAAGTDLFVIPANWPERRRRHWQTLLAARAIEDVCYVAGVNRVGSGGGLDYAGDSAIHDPRGEILASASVQEAVLVADVSADAVREARAAFPALQDRRF